VVEALLNAEKRAKQQHLQFAQDSLLGTWQLCFTTTGKTHFKQGQVTRRGGFYVPRFAIAQISFTQAQSTDAVDFAPLEIGNQAQIGSLLFRVAGQARYQPKKNLLAFDFEQMQLRLLGRWPRISQGLTLFQGKFPSRNGAIAFLEQPIAKLPFFAFFWVTPTAIAARGRGGGLAIWVRRP
jgi:hypothetical protein